MLYKGKKMKQLIFAALMLLLAIGSAEAQTQKPIKIGVVDVETIVKELPEAQDADRQLKDLGKKFQDSLEMMQKNLEEKYLAYEKQKGMMTPDQQRASEEELQKLQMSAMQYREMKFGANGELNQRRIQFLDPLREKVQNAIKKIAGVESMGLVLDKSSATVLFAEDKMDITYRVLDELKRGK